MSKTTVEGENGWRVAGHVPPATPERLAELLTTRDSPVDTSDIPERTGRAIRLKRDAEGRLPAGRESPIRRAILAALGRRKMNRYQLWDEARQHCSTLSQSAVYEFLRGQREIGLPYVEALMQAAGLTVTAVSPRKAAKTKAPRTTVG